MRRPARSDAAVLASAPVRPSRVLLVIGSLQLGGAERQVSLLAIGLARRGCEVVVFALQDRGPLAEVLHAGGVRVIAGGYRGASSRLVKGLSLVRAQARLLGLMLRWHPEVVHGFLPLTAFMASIAGRVAAVPARVVGRRALGTHQDRHPLWRPFDRLAVLFSNAVTANSAAVARDAARRDRVSLQRIHVIYNAIDTERFRSDPERAGAMRVQLGLGPAHIALGCVANLIPYKGHSELIDAFSSVALKFPNARLFLIGRDDGMQALLIGQVRRLGLDDRVAFLGSREDVADLLAAMDIGVLASHEEGFPNALMEMLAIGLPLVATSVGGVPELLDGMPDCLLVPARQPHSLYEAIERAIGQLDRSRANSNQRRARMVKRYGIDAMVDAHLALYRSMAGPSRA